MKAPRLCPNSSLSMRFSGIAPRVDRRRDELLADARLAVDEHRGLEGRDARHRVEQPAHRLGPRHHRVEAVLAREGRPELPVLTTQGLALLGLAKREGEVCGGEGLGEVVLRAGLDGRQRVVVRAVRAHHQHHRGRPALPQLREEVHPRAAAGHAHVGDHVLRGVALHHGERLVDARGGDHVPTLLSQVRAKREAEVLLVVDEQHPHRRFRARRPLGHGAITPSRQHFASAAANRCCQQRAPGFSPCRTRLRGNLRDFRNGVMVAE